MLNKFIKGHEYRDTGSWRYNYSDQFNLAFASGNKSIENCGGIRRRYFIKDNSCFRSQTNYQKIPSILVLITRKNSVQGPENPWNDEISENKLIYHGDNKYPKPFREMKGCQNLLNIFNLRHSPQENLIPPILHFQKNKSGYVVFTGRYALENIEVYPFIFKGFHIENIKCYLKLVSETINMKWIRDRSMAKNIQDLISIDNSYANIKKETKRLELV